MGTYLSPNPEEARHWRPNSTWYDSNLKSIQELFPSCQHEMWCDTLFDRESTEEFAKAMWQHQNPPDCNTAKLAILDRTWNSGMGSSLHVFGMAYAHHVLGQGRVLVTNADWVHYGAACDRPGGDNSLNCFFLPVSHCKPPAGSFPSISASDPSPRVVTVGVDITPKCENAIGKPTDPANPLSKFKDKPFEWWYPQIMRYVLRPQRWVLEEMVLPIQHATFWSTNGVIPHPLAALFIRRGDKHKEAPLHEVDEYFQKLDPIASKLNVRDVYISSDDFGQIEGAMQRHGDKYKIHYMDYNRYGGGLTYGQVTSMSAAMMRRHVRVSLADLYITAQADVVGGTLSSNWCRMQDGEFVDNF